MTHTIIRNVPTEVKQMFKIKCIEAGTTMQEALTFMMYLVARGDIPLQKKERKARR